MLERKYQFFIARDDQVQVGGCDYTQTLHICGANYVPLPSLNHVYYLDALIILIWSNVDE